MVLLPPSRLLPTIGPDGNFLSTPAPLDALRTRDGRQDSPARLPGLSLSINQGGNFLAWSPLAATSLDSSALRSINQEGNLRWGSMCSRPARRACEPDAKHGQGASDASAQHDSAPSTSDLPTTTADWAFSRTASRVRPSIDVDGNFAAGRWFGDVLMQRDSMRKSIDCDGRFLGGSHPGSDAHGSSKSAHRSAVRIAPAAALPSPGDAPKGPFRALQGASARSIRGPSSCGGGITVEDPGYSSSSTHSGVESGEESHDSPDARLPAAAWVEDVTEECQWVFTRSRSVEA
jgi:hypothetical protein